MKELKKLFGKSNLFLALNRLIFRSIRRLLYRLNTYYWQMCGVRIGENSVIQLGVKIEHPKRVAIGSNSLLANGVVISSENITGKLTIHNNVQINRGVLLDHTGGLEILQGSLISEGSIVYTHSHGYNPRSVPIGTNLIIKENVWIGAKVLVMAGIKEVASGSIIGSGAVLTKSTLENSVYGGNPAKLIKYKN